MNLPRIEPSTRSATVQAEDILKRLRAVQQGAPNTPKGLPKSQPNADTTDPDFPTSNQQPADPGYQLPGTVTGSGSGRDL